MEAGVQRTELVPINNIIAFADERCESRIDVNNKDKVDKLELYLFIHLRPETALTIVGLIECNVV